MSLQLEDYLVLSRADQKKKNINLKVWKETHPNSIERLIKLKYINEKGSLTKAGKTASTTVIETEKKLQKGIPLSGRKKGDPNRITQNGTNWITRIIDRVPYTANMCCIFRGHKAVGMTKWEDSDNPPKAEVVKLHIQPNQAIKNKLTKAEPYAYQIKSLDPDDFKVVWLKYGDRFLSIQAEYYDLFKDQYKNTDIYCSGPIEPVYFITGYNPEKKFEIDAVVMPFDATKYMQRPNL